MTSSTLRLLMAAMLVLAATAPVAHAQEEDPFGESAGSAVPAAVSVDAVTACAEVSSSICSKANTTFLTMCAGYVVVTLLICVLWTVLWSGRSPSGAGMKFAIPLVLGGVVAAVAVGFDPFASENYLCCVADSTFHATLFLGESRVARALVLGLLPFLVLYVIVVFVVKAVRR